MAVCEAQGPYLSISILRIASTLIWVFKKFFNQDLREQRRDLFKLRNFDHSEDSASNFQWILGYEIEMFFFSISCFAQPVAAYCLYIPKRGLVKIWRNPDLLRKQHQSLEYISSKDCLFSSFKEFSGSFALFVRRKTLKHFTFICFNFTCLKIKWNNYRLIH